MAKASVSGGFRGGGGGFGGGGRSFGGFSGGGGSFGGSTPSSSSWNWASSASSSGSSGLDLWSTGRGDDRAEGGAAPWWLIALILAISVGITLLGGR